MRILIITKNLYDFPGGAEHSLLSLIKRLSKNNNVKAVYLSKNEKSFFEDNVEFIPMKGDVRTLKNPISTVNSILYFLYKTFRISKKYRPDYIITQITFTPIAITIAKYLNVRTIAFLRSFEPICFKGFKRFPCKNMRCFNCAETFREKIFYPIIWFKVHWQRWALKKTWFIIANSQFMCDLFKEYLSVDSKVIYPFINYDRVVSDLRKEKEFITYITPRVLKGLDVFIDIVQNMPDRKFLVVGVGAKEDCPERLNNFKNVVNLGKVSDMRKVYAITRILLVPSIWPEPFGRVCLEAMANGIPCIASNVGGIKESLGDGGILIDDPKDIDSWIEAIKALDDGELYHDYLLKARKMIKKFSLDKEISKFVNLIYSSFD